MFSSGTKFTRGTVISTLLESSSERAVAARPAPIVPISFSKSNWANENLFPYDLSLMTCPAHQAGDKKVCPYGLYCLSYLLNYLLRRKDLIGQAGFIHRLGHSQTTELSSFWMMIVPPFSLILLFPPCRLYPSR